MKTNGLRGFIFKAILLILLSLYFLLVFGRVSDNQPCWLHHSPAYSTQPLPKLLSFEGISSDSHVKLSWKFETTEGLDECIVERADKGGEFKPIAYFFMTEDIHIPNLKFTDSVGEKRTYLYRLSLTGKDGDKQYTKALAFDVRMKEEQSKSLNYPAIIESH